MCGLFGFLATCKSEGSDWIRKFVLSGGSLKIREELRKRGKDDYGEMRSDSYFLSHSRLAIRGDRASAHQPFESDSGRYKCLFNGEIYEIDGLDDFLIEKYGDTKALQLAIEKYGVKECLVRLNGMFAIAIYDNVDEKLYLAIDYFGQKPLFFSVLPQGIIFGSTAKLVSMAGGLNTLCKNSLVKYLQYGFVPPDVSIYSGINKVPPGSLITISTRGSITVREARIQNDNKYLLKEKIPGSLGLDDLEAVLNGAVNRHLASDYPVGISLSGGVDSSLVAHFFKENSKSNLIGYTVDDHSPGSEAEQAKRYADTKGIEIITCDLSLGKFEELFSSVYQCMDEPHSDTAIVTSAAIFSRAKEDVKVVLTGDGGDEIFQGYNRHKLCNILYRLGVFASSKRRRLVSKLLSSISSLWKFFPGLSDVQKRVILDNIRNNLDSPKNLILSSLLIDTFGRCEINNYLSGYDYTLPHEIDQIFYLPGNNLSRVDRVSLFYGVESRPPLLDLRLLNFSRGINFHDSRNQMKALLKTMHRKAYPDITLDSKKKGFNTSVDKFVRTDLSSDLGRYAASFVYDVTGHLFIYDDVSKRRKYNLAALGAWLNNNI